MAQGVVDQALDHLAQPFPVGEQHRVGLGRIEAQRHAAAGGLGGHAVDGLRQDLPRAHRAPVELDLPGFGAGHAQQVLDPALQAQGALADGGEDRG